MKKKFLGIITVFLLAVFIIPSKVFAVENTGKVFTINYPNKLKSEFEEYKSLTMREIILRSLLHEELSDIIQGNTQEDGSYAISYKEEKSEESYIEVTDQMRQTLIKWTEKDLLEGYDKVSIKLVAPIESTNDSNFVVDLKDVRDKEYWDLPYITAVFPEMLLDMLYGWYDSDIISANLTVIGEIRNANDKLLATETMVMSDDEYLESKVTFVDGLTSADNIVYTITEEDIAEFEQFLVDEEEVTDVDYANVKKFVLKFVEADYPNDGSYYFYDVNADYDEYEAFREFFFEKLLEKNLLKMRTVIKNKDSKDLFYFSGMHMGYGNYELAPGVTSKDNIVLTITNEDGLYEFFTNFFGMEVNKLSLLFPEYKNYKVLDGANQKFDLSGKDKLSFRFDILLETFKRSGKVYMDGVLVDAKNYKLTSGSTIITFNDDYTNTLSQGNHTLKITTDEGESTTTFSVVDSVNNPNTGDNIFMYILLLGISMSSTLSIVYLKRKFN